MAVLPKTMRPERVSEKVKPLCTPPPDAGLGGNPCKSKYARRTNVRRSACAAACKPFCSSLARMKASIGFRTQEAFFNAGTAGRTGFLKDHRDGAAGVALEV